MTRDSHRLWLRGTAWVLVDRRGPHLRHPEKPSSGGRIDQPANKGGQADNALVCRCLSVPFRSELKEPPPLRQRLLERCMASGRLPCWDVLVRLLRPAQTIVMLPRRSRWIVVRSLLLRTRGTFWATPSAPWYLLRSTMAHARCIYPFWSASHCRNNDLKRRRLCRAGRRLTYSVVYLGNSRMSRKPSAVGPSLKSDSGACDINFMPSSSDRAA